MNKRTIGFVLIVVGAAGVVVFLLADLIGVGTYPGINGVQLLGAAVSLLAALGGVGRRVAGARREVTGQNRAGGPIAAF